MSAAGVSIDLARELRAICGDEHVAEWARKPLPLEKLCSPAKEAAPSLVATPGSADEVAAILRLANQHGCTVAPVGGGTDLDLYQECADILLQTARLREVEHYDPADLTAGVGAGMTVAELSAMVGTHRLMFGADPPSPGRATIGGLLAAAKQGPLRHGHGAVRDYCIGIRFVTGDGRKAKGGGRVVKNVAGYDLMKLLIGSYGSLAVITSASFKLFPAPRQTQTFLAEFATWREALKFRDLVAGSPLSPMCLELVSPRARKLMRPEMSEDAWVICVRAAGSDAVLARYRKELGSAVTREVAGEDEAALWGAIQNFPPQEANEEKAFPRRILLHTPPSKVGEVVEKLDRSPAEGGLGAAVVGRLMVGALVVKLPMPENTEIGGGGFWSHLAAPSGTTATSRNCWWGISAEQASGMRAVKQALDPNNVLRGRELSDRRC